MSPVNNRIDEAAAAWVIKLDRGALSAAEQEQLDAWLASDTRHHGALIRARAQWSDFDRLGALATGRMPAYRPARLSMGRRSLIAAGIAALAMVGAVTWKLAPTGERYVTAVGELRRVPLSDGSTMVLNTASEAWVHFEPSRREVHLLSGEALFEVAHDAGRPFVVYADQMSVRAVGTVFVVRMDEGRVDVMVSEGIVELAGQAPDVAGKAPQRLQANEHSVIAPSEPPLMEKLESAILKRRLAWLNGSLSFDGEPLGDAVAEVNRHSRRQIVVDSKQLREQPIVGVFRSTDTQGFSAAAAAALGAVVVEEGDTIHIRVRPDY